MNYRNKYLKMDYVRALKGPGTRNSVLNAIDAQSEVELSRHLDSAEKESLFNKLSPELVLSSIQQVLKKIQIAFISKLIFILVWLWGFKVFDVRLQET